MKKQAAILAALVCLLTVDSRADDDCYTQVVVKNKTGMKLELTYVELKWGKWDVGPPIKVAKGQEFLYKASGRVWSPSGTEGRLQYTLTDDDGYGGSLVYSHVWNLSFDGVSINDSRTANSPLKINYESKKCTEASGPGKCLGCQWILSLTQ